MQASFAKDVFVVNIDIEMPRMPCDIIGVDVEDKFGNEVSDYYGELRKHRLDSEGNLDSI